VPAGFIGGAGAGAGAGFLIAGPPGSLIGAIIGAILGLIGGAIASDPLTKWLTDDKKFKLFCIHLGVDHVDYPTPASVRRSYRYLMNIAHPDRHRDAPE
jgi:hypothetical protein